MNELHRALSADFLAALRKRFRGSVRTDLAHRVLYSTDASIYQIEPLGVAFPLDDEDLHALVETAARYRVPLLPRGAGSSLAGQAIGPALVIDFSRHCNHILEIDPEARQAVVQPGVLLSQLNRRAGAYGLQFGPDPASADRATLGGVIGNNGTGAHSIAYGMAADHLLAADVYFADGSDARLQALPLRALPPAADTPYARLVQAAMMVRERYAAEIRARWPHTWRNSAGYRLNYLLPWAASRPVHWPTGQNYPPGTADELNLAALLAGSEGTLAVMRRLRLNLVPRPRHRALVLLSYDELAAACDAVPDLLAAHPTAVELIPAQLLHLARSVPAYARQSAFIAGEPAALLAVEFSGDDQTMLEKQARALGGQVLLQPREQAQLWAVRKAGLGILMSRHGERRPVAFIEDTAVPVERLGDYVRAMQRLLRQYKTEAAFYAHASAGCLHIRPALDLRQPRDLEAMRALAEATLELALGSGGAMSSEHGDGLARAEWLQRTYGPQLVNAMRALKQAADPHGLLNPGKLWDAPPMDTQLRYGPDYQAHPWQPQLDFSPEGGLAGAIEHCNGAGVCRKQDGLMCPSFQATREEGHSTRGRANLLRALISGGHGLTTKIAAETLTEALEQQVYETLSLCLACKGCKAECPSGVDMARLKADFLAHYYRHHRRRLRDYLFVGLPWLAPRLARWHGVLRLGAWLARPWLPRLGIEKTRPLPLPRQPERFLSPQTVQEEVLFLPDVFTRFFEPEIEAAARQLLAACAVGVRPLPVYGGGRTLISRGFLGAARRHAVQLLDAVQQADPAGRLPVVGIEPSELYVIHDELARLVPERRTEAEALAARSWLVEEFLLRGQPPRLERLPVFSRSQNRGEQSEIVHLHGHCHQKARPPAKDGLPVGQAADAALLRALGYQVEIIPSGCCGMAGAFGYEAEHFALSLQIADLQLFPYLRAHAEGQVGAPGASCRTQIADGLGRAASHPLVLAARRL